MSSVEQRFLTLDQLHTLADAAGAHRPLVYVAGTTVAASELFPRTDLDGTIVYDFKLHELRHTAASLAIQTGANIKALQNILGHESAGLILDPLRPPVRI